MIINKALKLLQHTIASTDILTDSDSCHLYSHDDSRHFGLAEAVVLAREPQAVQAVVSCCYKLGIPLVARGKGTGTPGGAVPVQGGIVLSLEHVNKIIDYKPADKYIHVQSGMLNQTVQDTVALDNFCWAPDPGSAAYCTVGGNIAYNAAGPRAVKYGAVRENVLGLTAVTGTGHIIHTGGYVTKSSVGYDLTRLLIGSEGTLAIVTEAILKLTPLPVVNELVTVQINYKDAGSAALAITQIMSQAYIPEALEFLDKTASGLIGLEPNFILLLKINRDNINPIKTQASNTGLVDFTIDSNHTIWARRKTLSPALKTLSPHKINEDIVVPVSRMPELLEYIDNIAKLQAIHIVTFGHAGNGNLHVNLLIPHDKQAGIILNDLFDHVIKLGGTLSGEHGIGLEKKPYITKALDQNSLDIMRGIKKIFDPKNILNPGKIFGEK